MAHIMFCLLGDFTLESNHSPEACSLQCRCRASAAAHAVQSSVGVGGGRGGAFPISGPCSRRRTSRSDYS